MSETANSTLEDRILVLESLVSELRLTAALALSAPLLPDEKRVDGKIVKVQRELHADASVLSPAVEKSKS